MKTLSVLIVAVCLMCLGCRGFAQNLHLQKTNRIYLLEKAIEWNETFRAEKLDAIKWAESRNIPTRIELESDQVAEIIRISDSGVPEYYITNNLIAAQTLGTHQLWTGGSLGLNLNGQSMIIGEWDGGAVRATHQELTGRVVQGDGASTLSSHATHVAGTLIASGVINEAKGMAHQANLRAYDWNYHTSEMAIEAANGLLVSNHSYGNIAGWVSGSFGAPHVGNATYWWGDEPIDMQTDWRFGYYDSTSADWDDLVFNAPYYLIIKAAGNDRNDNHTGTHWFWNHNLDPQGWDQSDTFRNPDGQYDCLPTYACAKNILTIGAVNNAYNMSSFSGWGPTDDGRIKPDLVADGVGLFSSVSSGDSNYGTSSGTSMAGPNAAGSALLIQQHAHATFGEYLRAATLKALLIHTAIDLGNVGPDYSFGWGVMNSSNAISFMNQALPDHLVEATLMNGDGFEYAFNYDGSNSLKFTLCWTDPAGTPHAASLNNTSIKLVNDLDLRLTNVSTQVDYEPYTLDPSNPSLAATTGDNFRDNVEVIETGVLPAGNYTLKVTHKGSLSFGSQDFSLLASGPMTPLSLAFIRLEVKETDGRAVLTWETEIAESGDRFVIEKSHNGRLFYPLDTMIVTRQSDIFEYIDSDLYGSPIWYYCVQSIDVSGAQEFSPMVHLRPQQNRNKILIYPNPGIQDVYIESEIALNAIRVTDQLGRLSYRINAQDLYKQNGMPYKLDASDWISNVYIIEIEDIKGNRSQSLWIKSK